MVVFDMAGTTIDEDNVVYKTLQQSIELAGYPCSLEQVLAEGAGREKAGHTGYAGRSSRKIGRSHQQT